MSGSGSVKAKNMPTSSSGVGVDFSLKTYFFLISEINFIGKPLEIRASVTCLVSRIFPSSVFGSVVARNSSVTAVLILCFLSWYE